MLCDAMREVRKKKFDPKKFLKVIPSSHSMMSIIIAIININSAS